MPTRDDVLRELNLAPAWTPRTRPGQAAPSAAVDEAAEPASARMPRADEAQARLARIGALEWNALADDVAACTACGLCRTRNRTVPGVGACDADWLFVGEAPGADEDARGEPFVGQAGRLLDNMLAAAGLSRTRNTYITNVLKCRPPGNRTPEPLEADACKPYLERQVALVRPKIVIALGKSAASLLLATDAPVSALRGRVHRYGGAPLIVTYHPAYLLRTLQDKAKAWEDLVLARRTLAGAVPDAPVA